MADDLVADLRALAWIVDESADVNVTVTLVDGSLLVEAADEIERLQRWKAEATEVLERWDEVASMCHPRLGESKSEAVACEIERLRTENAAERALADQLAEALKEWQAFDTLAAQKLVVSAIYAHKEARRG